MGWLILADGLGMLALVLACWSLLTRLEQLEREVAEQRARLIAMMSEAALTDRYAAERTERMRQRASYVEAMKC